MLSFLPKGWRLGQVDGPNDTEGNKDPDDASSTGSMNLPWPVTEGASRKNKTPWTAQSQPPSNRDISHPIPRTIPMSRTGIDSAAPPNTWPHADVGASEYRPPIPSKPSSAAWYQESAAMREARKRELEERPDSRTGFYSPPEIVRLDNVSSNQTKANVVEGEALNAIPPRGNDVDTHLTRSTKDTPTYVYPHAYPYVDPTTSHAQQQHAPPYDEYDYEPDDFYTSQFDSDSSEDIHSQSFPAPPTNIPSPRVGPPGTRWAGLKLHTASPFSKSMQSLEDTPNALQPSVPTDVYNHSYNYPLAKQLSPIVEQDYVSPASAKSGSRIFGSRNGSMNSASPANQSVFRLASVSGLKGPKVEPEKEDTAKEHIRSRSGSRASSLGSMRTPGTGANLSRAGSLSVKEGNASGNSHDPSPGGSAASETISRPSPIYSSPFLTRPLNRTVSQTSSNTDSQGQCQPPSQSQTQSRAHGPNAGRSSAAGSTHSNPPSQPNSRSNTADAIQTPTMQTPTTAATTNTGTMFTPSSTIIQSPTSPSAVIIQPPPSAVTAPSIPPLDFRPFFPGPHPSPEISGNSDTPRLRPPMARVHPGAGKGKPGVDKMPIIHGSVEGPYSGAESEEEEVADDGEDYDSEEGEGYELESLHAESYVTADAFDARKGGEGGLDTLSKGGGGASAESGTAETGVHSTQSSQPRSANGESFIARRWERPAIFNSSPMISPTTLRTKKHHRVWPLAHGTSSLTPAFWAFWIGFIFPILWLVGGWHFTNSGELPPKYTFWEWYFWNRYWSWDRCKERVRGIFSCFSKTRTGDKVASVQGPEQVQLPIQRPQKKRSSLRPLSVSRSSLRTGRVYPALPRWVAEKQSTDDGRMRLNDPKRSLKGISFGYPFIPRLPRSLASNEAAAIPQPPPPSPFMRRLLTVVSSPNRLLDQLYGVKITEVRGRPESGRRMIDPWIQRCRYAFCYGLFLLAIGLCTTSAYLIVRNTKQLRN